MHVNHWTRLQISVSNLIQQFHLKGINMDGQLLVLFPSDKTSFLEGSPSQKIPRITSPGRLMITNPVLSKCHTPRPKQWIITPKVLTRRWFLPKQKYRNSLDNASGGVRKGHVSMKTTMTRPSMKRQVWKTLKMTTMPYNLTQTCKYLR